jgi:hypothetical protein
MNDFIVNFEVPTELRLKCPSFMDMVLHQSVTGSLYGVTTSQGKGRDATDLAALIRSFSESPDAMYIGFHLTGVLCKF